MEYRIREHLGAIRAAKGSDALPVPDGHEEILLPAVRALDDRLRLLDEALQEAVVQSRRFDGMLPDLDSLVGPVIQSARRVADLANLQRRERAKSGGDLEPLRSTVTRIAMAADEVGELSRSRIWRGYIRNAVLITGTGGSGKTHLLCDLAMQRVAAGLPTLIALGEQFHRGPILTDLARLVHFNGPPDHLLATFDVACQTAGEVGLVIIDAVNESTDRGLWRKYLASFLAEVARRPHLRLVLSCRSEYLNETLPASLQAQFEPFEHRGFEEVTRRALWQFLDWYGIERPSFPTLDPEFTNPFFLKLLCTTLQQREQHRFPRTGIGTTWIYENFLGAIDKRLASEDRCDYDPTSSRVRKAVELIAIAMAENGRRLPKGHVESITSSVLPDKTWSRCRQTRPSHH